MYWIAPIIVIIVIHYIGQTAEALEGTVHMLVRLLKIDLICPFQSLVLVVYSIL